MSPAVLAGQRLAALAASLRKDLERLAAHEQVARRLAADWATRQADPAQRACAATTLHAWYTGLETLLERALRQVDGEVPTGADSHRRVLEQAQRRSKRSRFITFAHAATKSRTNFGPPSALA